MTAGGTSDWTTSYSQYLARSTAQSAKTLKLYHEAMERVSQGKLAPSIFQDHFPAFAQAHAAEYTKKLTEIGARFLSGLVQLGTASSHQDPSATPPEPEIIPPRFETADPARWFQQMAEYAGQLNARALKAYRAQLDRVATGEATPSQVQETTADYLKSQVPQYLERAGSLYFELLNALSEVRAEYEEEYFRGILGSANGRNSEPGPVLHLTAPLGHTASASLSIANTSEARAEIMCSVSDVRRTDGQGPAFIPKLSIDPNRFELNPGHEGTFRVSLLLDPAQYDANAPYAGNMLIAGGEDLRVEMQLRITATQEARASQ